MTVRARRLLVVPLLALVLVPSASAAFSVTLNTGSPQTFAGITLNGVDQTSTLALMVTVVNTGGGNGAGWHVTAAATTPTSGANTLPPLQITAVSAAACTFKNCVDPTSSVTYPQTLSSTAVTIFNAAPGTGTGKDILTPTLQMTYDAKAFPGLYKSTLTVTGSTGP